MAEQVQSGPQQSRARRFLGAGKRTLDGEDRSERIKTGRKGTLFRAFSPTIKPEFPQNKTLPFNGGVECGHETPIEIHCAGFPCPLPVNSFFSANCTVRRSTTICRAWRLPIGGWQRHPRLDRKSTRLNSSHLVISYAVFCLKKQ